MSTINVDFDPKRQRLVLRGGFMYADVMRSFPSRRFDPKTKAWHMPLVRSNVSHLEDMRGKIDFQMTDDAENAIKDLERLTAPPAYVPFPREWFAEMKDQPLDHQWLMLDKGWNLKAYALFAGMGLGKTFTTIHTAMARWKAAEVARLVVICPQTLRRTWRRELLKYADPNECVVFNHSTNAGRISHSTKTSQLQDWMEANYNKLQILLVGVEGLGVSEQYYDAMLPFITGNRFVMGVVDESSRIKNPKRNRTQRVIEIGKQCRYRMILNGTPIALGVHDLWSQYEFLDPNIIGSGDYWAFRSRYVVMGGWENKQIVGYAHMDELMDLIRPYTLEIGKEVLGLIPKVYKSILIEPTAEQKSLFKRIKDSKDRSISAKNVLEQMLRLQQVVGGFEPSTDIETDITTTKPLDNNPKMTAMLDVIEDHEVGHKFIIWARFIPEIEMIKEKLATLYGAQSVVDYYGATSDEDRAIAEDRYCCDPTCRFLVGNPSAAGLGLTLISPLNDMMIYYSGTFAFIDRTQSEDRSHRIGQHNTVTIVDLVIEKSVDVAIQASIAGKMSVDQWVKKQLEAGKSFIQLVGGDDE